MWKAEPLSPSASSQLGNDEEWLYLDDDPVDVDKVEDPDLYDELPTRAQMASMLLEELDEWIKEGNFTIRSCLFRIFRCKDQN